METQEISKEYFRRMGDCIACNFEIEFLIPELVRSDRIVFPCPICTNTMIGESEQKNKYKTWIKGNTIQEQVDRMLRDSILISYEDICGQKKNVWYRQKSPVLSLITQEIHIAYIFYIFNKVTTATEKIANRLHCNVSST